MTRLRNTVFLIALALPWLNPFSLGPSAGMVPWLVSVACVGVVLLMVAGGSLSLGWYSFFMLNAAYFAAHMLWSGAGTQALAVLLAWGCVGLMARAGAGLAGGVGAVQGLARMWLGVALVSCLLALLQYLSVEQWFAPWVSASSDGTAYANLRQRNQFATLCSIGLVALLYLRQTGLLAVGAGAGFGQAQPEQYEGESARHKTQLVRHENQREWLKALASQFLLPLWPWAAAAVLATGTALSSSRTGALQWLLMGAAMLCWRASLRAPVRWLCVGSLGLYGLAVLAMPWFAQWVGNPATGLWGRAQEATTLGGSRLALYSNVLDLIAQKPWTGWGWRELAYAHYSGVFNVRFVELLDNAHNLPLHLAVELGLPYALLFCGAIVWWVLRHAPWAEVHPARQLAWAVLLLLGVHSMVEYPLWYGPFLMTLGLCLGLLQTLKYASNSALNQVNTAWIAIKFIAVCLLCLAAYLGFDYHRASQIYLDEASRSARYTGDRLAHAQQSWVYQRQARFAQLMLTPVTPQTAAQVLTLALDLVHFSPEPRVIEPLIEAATMLHFDDVAIYHLARYKAMYPQEYAAWSALR